MSSIGDGRRLEIPRWKDFDDTCEVLVSLHVNVNLCAKMSSTRVIERWKTGARTFSLEIAVLVSVVDGFDEVVQSADDFYKRARWLVSPGTKLLRGAASGLTPLDSSQHSRL